MYYYPRAVRDDDPKWRTKLLSQRWILPLAVISALFFIVGGAFLNDAAEKAHAEAAVLVDTAETGTVAAPRAKSTVQP